MIPNEPVATLFAVVLDEYCREKGGEEPETPVRSDAVHVIAGDAEQAVEKAKMAVVGQVYKGELEGEPYESTVIRAVLVAVKELETIDIL